MSDPDIRIKPLALIITIHPCEDGQCEITACPPGGNRWGLGISFPDHTAALAVATAIADNVDGSARIDGA